MKVKITYCAECGLGPLAVRLAERMLEAHEHDGLGEVRIEVGSGGAFDVSVDGELIFSRKANGPLPEIDDVVTEVSARLRPEP